MSEGNGRPCEGGFCGLIHHPITSQLLSFQGGNKSNLCKREKRIQRSRQRDRALRLVKWVLTEEEYSSLEDTGDLVRLRLGEKAVGKVGSSVGEGLWVDGAGIDLAKRECRPELARLAFAEVISGEENDIDGEPVVSDVSADVYDCANVLEPQNCVGNNKGCFLVCGVCYHVHHLLEQARSFLESYKSEEFEDEARLASECNNEPEKIENPSSNATTRSEGSEGLLNDNPKKSSSGNNEEANGSELRKSNNSFHGPISSQIQTRPTDIGAFGENAKKSGKRGKPAPSDGSGTKRERKHTEENSKIRILIAESDEATAKLAKRLLEKQGFKVDCASNSGDCIKSLESKNYSILLLCDSLAGKDASSIGVWVRKKEKSESCRVKTRILVIVQSILSVKVQAFDDCDIDGFLPKPLEGIKLIPTVEKAASQYFESVLLAENSKKAADDAAAPESTANVTTKQQKTVKSPSKEPPKAAVLSDMCNTPSKKVKPVSKHPQSSFMPQKMDKLKKEDPISSESVFQYDEHTSFPYAILHNGSEEVTPDSSQSKKAPWCNLIVCHDVFDTYERFKILFLPMVARYRGMKVLLWNYPGQAYTSFTDEPKLNNKYHADCLSQLLIHLRGNGKGKFDVERPFFVLAHGSGAAIATYFAASQRLTSLKGIVLVNGLSHVDSHYASVFHECRNVFACSPESRPDLPVYFYARFLFSPSYLSKTSSSLALNVYTAVHNPITLNGRKRLCQGVLDHVDTRPMLKDIGSPIICIHGENSTLVRSLHASEFLSGRRNCPTIPQALRGGNRTAVVMMKGGHELFQEKKEQIYLLIEQILKGYHDKIGVPPNLVEDADTSQESVIQSAPITVTAVAENFRQKAKSFEDRFIDRVLLESRNGNSRCDAYQDEIMMQQELTPQSNTQQHHNLIKKDKRQTEAEEKKEFDPNEYPEVKEYMAWRIRRHKKRLAALEKSARIIQCALRVFMAKTMIRRVRRHTSAIRIQSYVRGIFGREVYRMKKKERWAAIFVQRALRGHKGRCISYNKRMERRAQIQLSRMIRGLVARRRLKAVLKRREFAATKIQSIWLMHGARHLLKLHRSHRDSSIVIQRIFRGHVGRRKAALERDKYIFSRSQNSGIEMARQMLTEHKLHMTKLQSEISLLEQEDDNTKKQVEFKIAEIRSFERNVSELEKKTQQVSKYQRETYGITTDIKQSELREEKRRLDEEYKEALHKISDRKRLIEQLNKKSEQNARTQREKKGELKKLNVNLAVLSERQDSELEGIRKKQEQRIDKVISSPSIPNPPPTRSEPVNNPYYSGPSERERIRADYAELLESQAAALKYSMVSSSLSHVNSLNAVLVMKRIVENDALAATVAAMNDKQYPNMAADTTMPGHHFDMNSAVRFESWSVNDVSNWLKSISLSQYQSAFKEGAVDGSFLCELTDDDLKNTLGVEHRLHRKKILFGIGQLKNCTEGPTSQPAPNPYAHSEHHALSVGKSVASMTPNSTLYEESVVGTMRDDIFSKESYSTNGRHHVQSVSLQSKSNSVLDILTPAKPDKPIIPLCDFDQLRSWVRHQKHENIREALDHITDGKFRSENIRIQYVEEIGTAYTQSYEHEPFNLNRVDEHGNTLMHIAAQTGNIRIAKLLIRKGANPDHQNKQGQTPGHFAVAYHFFDFASWLFDEKGGGANDLLTNMYDLGPYDGLDEG